MAFVGNNSRNVANLLRQNDQDDQANNRIRVKKVEKSSSKQIGNVQGGSYDPQIRPSSQQQQIAPRQDIKQPTPPTVDLSQGTFPGIRRRRETPPQDETGSVHLEQLTSSANNITMHVQALQQQLYNESKRNRKTNEQIQLTRMKMQENARYFEERQAFLEAKFQAQIAQMQTQLARQRQGKLQVQHKVGSAQLGQKEMVYMMKNIQDQYATELLGLKSMIQDKRSEQQAILAKQKEKSTALFLELVRQGDNLQKAKETLQSITNNFEGRVQYLENKLSNSEKNLVALAQRNSTGSDMMSEFGDKILGRLQSVESNLLVLGKEQLKDKEYLNKLDGSTNRVVEDLNGMLRNMQNDLQGRLEGRVTEIVNRIVYEHEERVKAQEDIKKNLDLRERIIAQKQIAEKDKIENRYNNMDGTMKSQIRSEFIRKEESIKALQNALEDQHRFFQKEIEKQDRSRQGTENSVASELKRIQQNFRKEYDIYKLHQVDLVEKITEMIKSQINTRLSSDVDLKNLTSAIATDLVNDLNNLKEAFSGTTKKMNGMIKQVKAQSSERAAQLSHYVDEEVRKLADVVTEKYNKMKSVFTKLSEHFRNHLISTETNRKNFEARVSSNERDFQVLKNEVNSVIDEFHTDLQARFGTWKEDLETLMFKKQNENTIRLNKLEEYVTQHFELIKEGLEGNKELLNAKLGNLSTQRGNSSDVSNRDFKELVELVHRIKDINENFQSQSETQIKQIQTSVQDNLMKGKEDILHLKTELSDRLNDQSTKISQIEGQLKSTTNKLNTQMTETKQTITADREANNQNFKTIQQDMSNFFANISNLETAIKNAQDRTDEEVAQVRSQLTILQTEVKSSDKTIHEDINRLIEITEMLKARPPADN